MTIKFRPHSTALPDGAPPRHVATGLGKIEGLDPGSMPSIRAPSDLDIFNAISDVSKKLAQLAKNQQVLDAKLDYITQRLDAANANVVMGVQYLGRMGMSTQWLIAGDYDASTSTLPKHGPHWQ